MSKLAPFNSAGRVLKRPCKPMPGFPHTIAWNIEDFLNLVSMYGYDAIPEHIDRTDLDALCLYFSGVLPHECMHGYKFNGMLGQGAGGEVHIVCKKDDCAYAAKYVILTDRYGENQYLNEVNIMNKLYTLGIGLQCEEHWICNLPMYNMLRQRFDVHRVAIMVMPLAEYSGSELLERYDFEQVKPLFVNILTTLVSNGIMHRDLKLENMVVYHDALKLIDFGLSWELGTEDLHKGQANWTYETIPAGWDPLFDTRCLIASIKRYYPELQSELDNFMSEMTALLVTTKTVDRS